MSDEDKPSRENWSNLATYSALAGLLLAGALILGLAALVLPQILGVLLVVLLFVVPVAFHYLVWGWWMSQSVREDDDD